MTSSSSSVNGEGVVVGVGVRFVVLRLIGSLREEEEEEKGIDEIGVGCCIGKFDGGVNSMALCVCDI